MYNEFLPVQPYELDERNIGRPFGRPWGYGFGRPWGFGRPYGFVSPFLGGLAGGLLGSALFAPFGYGYPGFGFGYPGYGFGYPYYW